MLLILEETGCSGCRAGLSRLQRDGRMVRRALFLANFGVAHPWCKRPRASVHDLARERRGRRSWNRVLGLPGGVWARALSQVAAMAAATEHDA